MSEQLKKDPCVLEEKHDVYLIDRRKIVPGTYYYNDRCEYVLRDTKSRYYWMVLDLSKTRYHGEWRGHKTRKEAVKDFENTHRRRSHARSWSPG